jgi:hypothetical protein
MFRCLADEGPQKQIVRRSATVDEIRQVADTDLSTVIDVAQAFLRPDRSFLKTQRLENIWTDSTLDVSHEALLRHWEKVQKWLEGEAEAKHTFLRLSSTWLCNGRQDKNPRWHEPNGTKATYCCV